MIITVPTIPTIDDAIVIFIVVDEFCIDLVSVIVVAFVDLGSVFVVIFVGIDSFFVECFGIGSVFSVFVTANELTHI